MDVRTRSTGLVTLFALAACGGDGLADRGSTVRDSAGITIVESFEPSWGEGEGWQLSAEPILDIGVVEGDPAYQLHDVIDAARGPDGKIVIANGGPQEIRVFDVEGRFLRTVGGEGDGPGEFRDLVEVQVRPADSIVAVETRPHRLAAFEPTGDLVWTKTLDLEHGSFVPKSSNDGAMVVASVVGDDHLEFRDDPASIGRFLRVRTTLIRYSPDGNLMDTIGTFPGQEWASLLSPEGRRSEAPPWFGRNLVWAARGGDIYVGTGESYEVAVYGSDGSLRRIVRQADSDLQITQADQDSVAIGIRLMLEQRYDPSVASRLEQSLAAIPFAEQRVPHGDLLVDSEGCLWIAAYDIGHVFGTSQVMRWDVFDPEGRWLGEMTVPDGFRVFEIGEDYVLGLATDELDVEHVRMYGLTR